MIDGAGVGVPRAGAKLQADWSEEIGKNPAQTASYLHQDDCETP